MTSRRIAPAPLDGRLPRRTLLVVAAAALAGCTSTNLPSTAAGTSGAAAGRATVTLLRHGESIASAAGIVSTAVPGLGLTATGHGQADRAASGLAGRGFDAVFASPLTRARETADAFTPLTGRPVTTLDGLAEVTAGDYEGQLASEVAGQFLAVLDEWLRGDLGARVPGGESGSEFLSRMDAALAQVTASSTNALVVSHGEAIRCWTTLRVPSLGAGTPLAPTGYQVVGLAGGRWQPVEAEPGGF